MVKLVFSSSPRGGDLFRHYTRQGTNTGSCLGPLESRAVVEAGFGVHVAVKSGLFVVVVSDAGALRVVSGGVGDLYQACLVLITIIILSAVSTNHHRHHHHHHRGALGSRNCSKIPKMRAKSNTTISPHIRTATQKFTGIHTNIRDGLHKQIE